MRSLDRAVANALATTVPTREIVIVSDGTTGAIDPLVAADARVRVIRGTSLDDAIAVASGEQLALLDEDGLWVVAEPAEQ
jgi:hypothetical protein